MSGRTAEKEIENRPPVLDRVRAAARSVRRLFTGPRAALCLSGGGCKAFFALGVGKVLIEGGVPVRVISGTSAGSAMAMALLAGHADDVVRYFYSITLRNESNFYWSRLFRGRRPFPHERMYRSTLSTFMDLERLKNSPIDLAINALLVPRELYRPEARLRRARLLFEVMAAYRREMKFAEQGVFRPFLRDVARAWKLEETVFWKSDLATARRAEDVVLASSSAPPIVRFQRIDDGNYYLDGGIYNNLPVSILPPSDLVIAVYYEEITRRLLELSGDDVGREMFYIAPPQPLPITSFDYANAKGVRETYEIGLRAGEQALRRVLRLI